MMFAFILKVTDNLRKLVIVSDRVQKLEGKMSICPLLKCRNHVLICRENPRLLSTILYWQRYLQL